MLIDSCDGEPEWTFAVLPRAMAADVPDAFGDAWRDLEELIYICAECSCARTSGLVYHNRPSVSHADIEQALFARVLGS